MGNWETISKQWTAARDALTKENEALKAEMRTRKTKRSAKKIIESQAASGSKILTVLYPPAPFEYSTRFLYSSSVKGGNEHENV